MVASECRCTTSRSSGETKPQGTRCAGRQHKSGNFFCPLADFETADGSEVGWSLPLDFVAEVNFS